MEKPIIQVTTHPFGICGDEPRLVLEKPGWEIRYNPFDRCLRRNEVARVVGNAHGVIAGTELYSREVIRCAPNLRVISRVGVGLDNIDYATCHERSIIVTYTPKAPANAVAELAVAQILNLLRRTHESDKSVREGAWNRFLGHLISEVRIGILGVGRIGKRVIELLQPFKPDIYGCDLSRDTEFGKKYNVTWVNMVDLFSACHLVSIHVPLNQSNYHLVGHEELQLMQRGGYIVNLARGGVVDETSLVEALRSKHLSGAAVDVFEEEPYEGSLIHLNNVILTAHMGASAKKSRFGMELEAAKDCVRVLSGEDPGNRVTQENFALRSTLC
jgi:D-3-phosphoglycerate dehydrogenase